VDGGRAIAVGQSGALHECEVIYSLAGARYRAELALALGARTNAEGELEVDENQRTSLDGLYAAGDVAAALNQISIAAGQAAIAASAIHDTLPSNWR
jgi:thioredoxin reductase (NADPH)